MARNADGRPVDWAPYPETGIYLYAECLCAELYLSDLRPKLTPDRNDVSHDFVASTLYQLYAAVDVADSSPNVSPTIQPFLKVAFYALAYLTSILQKPLPSRVAVEKVSLLDRIKKVVPKVDDIARKIPARVFLLFMMRVMYLPLVWMARVYAKRKPEAAVAGAESVVLSSLPATERKA